MILNLVWKMFLYLLTLIYFSGCSHDNAQESRPTWHTGLGPARGHEDLTRLGIGHANEALRLILGYHPFPKVEIGASGIDTQHPMLLGNYETDFPTQKMYDFLGIDSSVDWHHEGSLQYLHSLRNRTKSSYQGLRESCLSIRQGIRRAAEKALESHQNGKLHDTLYWLGHGTHIVQDSFSRAHTSRTSLGNKKIVDICTYGEQVEGSCHHKAIDLHDRIWKESLLCQIDPRDRGFACLKDEAQTAVVTTGGFLTSIGHAIYTGAEVSEALDQFFKNPEKPGFGAFNCEEI